MRYLGIDFGKKRIGLAVGEMIPRGMGVIDGTKSQLEIIDEIAEIIRKEEIGGIVIGVPNNENQNEVTSLAEKLGNKLSKTLNIPVWNEAEEFTSVEAERLLKESKVLFSKKTGEIDEMAAVLILQQFIDNQRADGREKTT